MNNFFYNIPTKIYFGKGSIENLKEIRHLGKTVLLHYGGGSIKRNGIYDRAVEILKASGMDILELPGVEPNPRIDLIREGQKLCKEKNVDVVLAIGGGSVIDSAKVIAAGAKYEGDPWDLVLDPSKIKAALPVVSVLTLSATGSEMDGVAVITNLDGKLKLGMGGDLLKPVFSILDPEYTYSVPKNQTAAGTADIMSHTFENYFNMVGHSDIQKGLCETLLRTCIKYGPIAIQEPDNYDARANLMWASSLAINGMCSLGCQVPWTVHSIEHELSAFYDITHGVGLAILTPVWMEYVLSEKTLPYFVDYGINVWHLDPALGEEEIARKAIAMTREFFNSLGLPATLTEVGIDDEYFDVMAERLNGHMDQCFVPLNKQDVIEILKKSR